MRSDIDNFVSTMECPIENAIYTLDGKMHLLNSVKTEGRLNINLVRTTILKHYFELNDPDYTTSYDIFKIVETELFKISLGEGGFGSDGVAYLTNKMTEEVLWFLFVDNSDPFCNAVILPNNNIVISSTSDLRLLIPNEDPKMIRSYDARHLRDHSNNSLKTL